MADTMRNGAAKTVFDVRVYGDAPASFRAMAYFYPQEMARAVRHTAWLAQYRLKAEMLQRIPGGRKIDDISQIQKWRVLDAFNRANYVTDRYGRKVRDANGNSIRKYSTFRRGTHTHLPFYMNAFISKGRGLAYGMSGTNWPIGGKLAQLITYRHKKGSLTASFGWDRWTKGVAAARMAMLWQKGQTRIVTPDMRRFFALAGVLLSKHKTHIIQPARPVIRYFFEGRKKWMARVMWDRMHTLVNAAAAKTTRMNAHKLVRGRFL